MIYIDTSVVMATITREPSSETVQSWMRGCDPQKLCVSEWVATELSSALAIKMRRNEFSTLQRAGLLSQWQVLRDRSLRTAPVPQGAFGLAAHLIDDPASTLGAGDALHLAIASLGRHSLATLDVRLAEAAERAGVAVEAIA